MCMAIAEYLSISDAARITGLSAHTLRYYERDGLLVETPGRAPSGELSVDLRGKAAGRGAYCDPDPACLERGLREGALARALEVTIDEATAERLRVEMNDAAAHRRQENR